MSIKTLLVHLAPDPDWETRLHAAVGLAKRLDAHLIALYVASPVHLPAGAEGRGASALFLQEARESARQKAGAVEETVRRTCEDAGISYNWAYGEADHLDHLLEEVHHVDLTILNQVSFDHFEDRLMYQLPEKLVIGAGGPVLVLPKGMTEIDIERTGTVLIAWTYSREAIRALRDSLSILKKAKSVHLLICGNDKEKNKSSAIEVKSYLKRHDIDVAQLSHAQSGHAGDEILDVAEEIDADLVVMGAYGHTSMLDKFFGSASRYVIGHAKVPLFMSH